MYISLPSFFHSRVGCSHLPFSWFVAFVEFDPPPPKQQLAADSNKDEDVLKTSIGVVGDLAQGLGPAHAPHLRTPGILALLNVRVFPYGNVRSCGCCVEKKKIMLFGAIRSPPLVLLQRRNFTLLLICGLYSMFFFFCLRYIWCAGNVPGGNGMVVFV